MNAAGLRPLHVPGVKVLVTRKPEKTLVVARYARLPGLRQIIATEDQARRRPMLEAAVTVADREAQKPIAIERRGPPEEIDLRLADLPQIRADSLEVRLETSGDDQVVRHAGGFEVDALEVADLDRVVEQLIVIGRTIDSEAALVDATRCERRRDAPILAKDVPRRLDRELYRLRLAPVGQDEHARSVEVTAAPIQVCTANRLIERMDGGGED